MKKLMKISFLSLMLLTILNIAVPALAHSEGDPFIADLVAGNGHWTAGEVQVWNDATHLYVRYVAYPGWQITETHVYVGNGLPGSHPRDWAPGRFPYGDEYITPMTVVTYSIPLGCLGPRVFVAAHAVVQHPCTIYDETAWGWAECHSYERPNAWGWAFWYDLQ